jgi:phosphoenolpyruvate-protein phosphotransferase (PTS system enzyme I)
VPDHVLKGEQVYRGIPVSPGVCRGRVLILRRGEEAVERREIPVEGAPHELQRFQNALVATRHQLLDVQKRVEEKMGAKDAGIFEAHLLVLEDPMVLEQVSRVIGEQRINAEAAFNDVIARYIQSLESIEDEYLKERVADMRDVAARVLNALSGRGADDGLAGLTEPSIIISHDLAPSLTATLDKSLVLGFATDVGGKTSHTAILARSLQIPAVVGLKDITAHVVSGQQLLLDGFNGVVVINPTDQTLFEYGHLVRKQVDLQGRLQQVRDLPAVTLDGAAITLSSNVEGADDIEQVRQSGSEGVGLFRTEYLFINRRVPPTEEEQFAEYRKVAEALNPQPVIIRTLDLGGDKLLSHAATSGEMNPFLGWRAIRYCLQEQPVFRAQVRAILRASVFGNVKMMYPLVSGLAELQQANALVAGYQAELRAEGVKFNEALDIGVMIEVPSAVLVADALAKHVKFFSIGTNDLIQYTLAVDRLNERITHLYQPTHPAILRLIKMTVEAAHRNGLWVGVCGEMAGDPTLVPLLVGLEVDELSAAPANVPAVKFLIRRLKRSDTRALAESALICEDAEEIARRSEALAKQCAPGLFELTTVAH